MKDSTLVAVRTSSEAEKGEKVDVDQAERRRASNAEMGTMGFPVSSRNGHLVQFYGDRVPPHRGGCTKLGSEGSSLGTPDC